MGTTRAWLEALKSKELMGITTIAWFSELKRLRRHISTSINTT